MGEKTRKTLTRQVKEKDFSNTISAIKQGDKLVMPTKAAVITDDNGPLPCFAGGFNGRSAGPRMAAEEK